MTRSRLHGAGARAADDPGKRQKIVNYRPITAEADLRRYSQRTGIQPQPGQHGLNDLERLVHDVLDEEYVTAQEIAGFAQGSVHRVRRALATLRTLGLADAKRRGQINVWRRA